MATDKPKLQMKLEWRVEKFDGEPPQAGEEKAPVEVITGTAVLPLAQEKEHGTD